MFSKKNTSSRIDPEQRELIERAQARAKEKRRLYQHFLFFLAGAVILILLNVVFEYGKDVKPFGIDWFVWAIILWGIIFLLHAFNVFVTNRFLGKDWEDRQIEKLVEKQRKRIAELERRVEKDHPLPDKNTPLKSPEDPLSPDAPLNT